MLAIEYFWIHFFKLKSKIAGTLANNFFLMLFSKKKLSRMKSETQFYVNLTYCLL
jgi:hypothetical protein